MTMQKHMLSQRLSSWRVFGIASLLVLAGCAAAYTPPPLPTSHPAHPEATVAPEPPPSHTLAYGSADVPSPQPTYAVAQSGMQHSMQHGAQPGMQGAHPSKPTGEQFVGEGKVIAVVPNSMQLVVDHQDIPGFMDAMTMGYRVDPPSLLEGLQAGDLIRFTIDAQHKAIVKIEKQHE
jgi:Cu/Ag efflux protein CusF